MDGGHPVPAVLLIKVHLTSYSRRSLWVQKEGSGGKVYNRTNYDTNDADTSLAPWLPFHCKGRPGSNSYLIWAKKKEKAPSSPSGHKRKRIGLAVV